MAERAPKVIRAYHFVGATLRDGRPVPKDSENIERNDSKDADMDKVRLQPQKAKVKGRHDERT